MKTLLQHILLAVACATLAVPALAAEGGPALLPPVPALPRLEPSWVPVANPAVFGAVDLLGTGGEAVLWLAPGRPAGREEAEAAGPPAASLQAEEGLQGQVGVTLRPLAGAGVTASVARLGARTDLALSIATPSARFGMLYLYDTRPGTDDADRALSKGLSEEVLRGGGNGVPLFILPRSGASLLAGGSAEQPLRTYGVYGDLALGDKVGVHWAVGYAAVAGGEQGEKKAWEYNVGIAYRLLGNLLYEAHFGYLTTQGEEADPPPALRSLPDGAPADRAATIDQVYLITNKVTMHF